MSSASRHVAVTIDRPVEVVYAYAANPANLPTWAAGLAGTSVEFRDGHWSTDSSLGRVSLEFVAANSFGVLDHDITLPSGETVYNPMRATRNGDGCEVVFTVRRRPEMTDDDFAADASAVAADLDTLPQVLEGQ